ncbi:MAG: signal recognition particle-docking protein FtsY [Bacillota bacterium]|nr:signal recognition particle-docking protein FtsY [Bacillota bacterium]
MSIFNGMKKSRGSWSGLLSGIFHGRVDEDFYEELEEALILADVGVETSIKLCQRLRERAAAQRIREREQLWQALREEMVALFEPRGGVELASGRLNIIVMTGVNGAGKTTTIGKLAARWQQQGQKVLLAAADTFRAAAAEQLAGWAERTGAPLIRQNEGADPAAVVFDALAAARARAVDVLIVDTAGRLQNKSNLMAELGKIGRVIEREAPDAAVQALLVVDGGVGQNAIEQARQFGAVLKLDGVIVTKLDGTAKGGAVLGIADTARLPVLLIGVGEQVEDLRDFEAAEFVRALFEEA